MRAKSVASRRRRLPEVRGERPDVAASHEVRPAPRSTTTRRLASAAHVGGVGDERIDHREIERVERVRAIQRQRRDGPSRASRTVSFIGMGGGRAPERAVADARSAEASTETVDGEMLARIGRVDARARTSGVAARHRRPKASPRPARRWRAPRRRARARRTRRSRGRNPDRRSRAPTTSSPARGRGRACGCPGRRPRNARSRARCRTRSPGSSRPRNAARTRNRSRPNSGPTACRASNRSSAAQTGTPSRRPTASITLPGSVGADALEEFEIEVRRRVMIAIGVAVAAVEERPVRGGDLARRSCA